jgi:hypothetical protein
MRVATPAEARFLHGLPGAPGRLGRPASKGAA